MKKTIVILILFGIFKNSFSQTVISTRGKIVFFDDKDTSKSRQLHDIAKLCSSYIQKFYPKVTLPNVLLDIELSKDTSYSQLGYDNIYGNSIENDIYERKTKDYTNLGIRIKSCMPTINKEDILKLLDYGIKHAQELKNLRTKATKLDYYDRPKTSTLPSNQINAILRKPPPPKIKKFLSENK